MNLEIVHVIMFLLELLEVSLNCLPGFMPALESLEFKMLKFPRLEDPGKGLNPEKLVKSSETWDVLMFWAWKFSKESEWLEAAGECVFALCLLILLLQ